ncbi:MAG: phosphoenolpyruvate synthase [Chlamydiales bacterium]|nr:phosphoenolpyruvate synthase [Chlamydiales bacterium]
MHEKYIRWFSELKATDTPLVGGKNASLGEMFSNLSSQGIAVPDGFATTADAYWDFLKHNHLKEKIRNELKRWKGDEAGLRRTGKAIRSMIGRSTLPDSLTTAIKTAYKTLSKQDSRKEIDVAVRSSATAEDLPTASFAGQQESFLNVVGEEDLIDACIKCFVSLFTDRAIFYRHTQGFDQMQVALSIGIQKMVRADLAGSGVIFTLDPESGFPGVVMISAGWGLGENVVQGAIVPDQYLVFKPLLGKKTLLPILEKTLGKKEKKLVYAKGGRTRNITTSKKEQAAYVLSDQEILTLGKWAAQIERHYKRAMDIEWAKDGKSGKLYIVQARPETIHSQKKGATYKSYNIKRRGKVVAEGLAIGEAIVTAPAQVIKTISEIGKFKKGSILVTPMTSPDWVPIMEEAAGIITDHGGRTSHAAIVSRELGLPAIVGCGSATRTIKNGAQITLSCAEGERGFVYAGKVDFEENEISLDKIPETPVQIMLNIASPEAAFRTWQLPAKGVGLARMEFIINNIIKIHPMALVHPERVKDAKTRKTIEKLTAGYKDKKQYFIDKLAEGIAKIAATRYPHPVIVRMSDFKTNEYANLIGGEYFEPKEENPMLGFRGASRYYNPRYREGFDLECAALCQVRKKMGLTNTLPMIPFCRTLEEADRVLEVMAENGLKRGEEGLQVYVMAEIPSNIILAEEFSDRFDGFSIGSNDLTQLILGIDRDSAELAPLFDERNPSVKKMISDLIKVAHRKGRKVGICGQAPSDYPDFAEFLVSSGIDSLSLNPDSILPTIHQLTSKKKK